MFELWKVMGRVMLDKGFLQRLRSSINNQTLDPGADNQSLQKALVKDKAYLTRFERGEVQYWLRDEVFVDTLEKLEERWTSQNKVKEFKDGFDKAGGLYAAAALALFDKLFSRLLTNGADLTEFGFRKPEQKLGANQHRDEKILDDNQRKQLVSFLTDDRVEKLFNILERLGWDSACREAVSFEPTYEHEHDGSSSSPSMSMKRPRGY